MNKHRSKDEEDHEHEHRDDHKDDHVHGEEHDEDHGHSEDNGVHHQHDDEHDNHEEDYEVHDHEHLHGPTDPHYWLSLHNAEQIAINIAEELAELDPKKSDTYFDRAEQYAEELEIVERELLQRTENLVNRNVISLHDAWQYFANDFNLNLVGTFEPSAGTEPTPRYLQELQEAIEDNNVTTLFVEPQLSTDAITVFAEDNNLGIAVIDPLGGVDGRSSYIELMRYNVNQVVKALSQ